MKPTATPYGIISVIILLLFVGWGIYQIKPSGIDQVDQSSSAVDPLDAPHLSNRVAIKSDNSLQNASHLVDTDPARVTMSMTRAMYDLRNNAGFFENKGQYPEDIQYVLERRGMKTLLFPGGFGYLLEEVVQGDAGDSSIFRFVNVQLKGANQTPGTIASGQNETQQNFLDRDATAIHHYQQVTYKEIYPGIDLIFEPRLQRGRVFGVKHSFLVKPGADPSQIQLTYDAIGLSEELLTNHSESAGDVPASYLKFTTGAGTVGEALGDIYTIKDGIRTMVDGRYVLTDGNAGFQLGSYNVSDTLIIDPELVNFNLRVSTYFGKGDGAEDVIYDVDLGGSESRIYVTGASNASDLLTGSLTTGFQAIKAGGNDAFVAAFDATLETLLWATYLGAGTATSDDDVGFGITIEDDGGADLVYVCGALGEDRAVPGDSFAGESDGFVARISNDGQTLDWIQNIGGSGIDYLSDLSLVGSDLILTGAVGAAISEENRDGLTPIEGYNGGNDALLVKLQKSNGQLTALTYYGTADEDRGHGITARNDEIYITGPTDQENSDGEINTRIYVARFDQGLNFSDEFIAGRSEHPSNNIPNQAIALSEDGDFLAITGVIPVRSSAIITGDTIQQDTYGGNKDAYLIRLSTNDLSIEWGTYYGGSKFDAGYGVAIDCQGFITLTGTTSSTSGIATSGSFGGAAQGDDNGDVFVAKFTSGGTRIYGRYFGDTGSDVAFSIALNESEGTFVLGGQTRSADSIATEGVFQEEYSNANDGFVSVFCDLILTNTPQDLLRPVEGDATFSVSANACGSTVSGYQWYFGDSATGDLLSEGGTSAGGASITGAMSPSLTLSGLGFPDEGTYCVVITTVCGESVELCADLEIVGLTGNSVCLDNASTLGNPSSDQETITLEFADLETTSAITNATYSWELVSTTGETAGGINVIDGGTGGAGSFPFDLPSGPVDDLFRIEISPSAAGSYTYRLTFEYDDARSGEREEGEISTTVEVYSFQTVTDAAFDNSTICEDEVATLSVTTDETTSRLEFERIDSNTAELTGHESEEVSGNSNPAEIVLDEFSNETNQALEATFRITPFSSEGCEGIGEEITITVKPNPVFNVTLAADTICNGDNAVITFEAQSSPVDFTEGDGTSFSYEVIDVGSGITGSSGSTADVINLGTIDQPLTNSSGEIQTITYRISADYNGCIRTQDVTVTVLPSFGLSDFDDTLDNCSGISLTVTLNNTLTELATQYRIEFDDNPNITGQSPVTLDADAGTPIQYSNTFTNLTSTAQTLTGTVTPSVTIEEGTVCFGTPEDFVWDILPNPTLSDTTLKICDGGQLDFELSLLSPELTGATFTWTASSTDGNVIGFTADQNTNTAAITDELTLVSGTFGEVVYAVTADLNGCTDLGIVTVEVEGNPSVDLSVSPIQDVCTTNPEPVTITASFDASEVTEVRWFLDDVQIAGADDSTLEVTESGTYRVAVTNTAGCEAEGEIEINPVERVNVTIDAGASEETCSDDEFVLRTSLSGGTATASSYLWLRDGAVLSGATLDSLVIPGPGDYQVIINASEACPDSSQVVPVNFFANPEPDFTLPTEICPMEDVELEAVNNNAAATIVRNTWTVDGATPLPVFADDEAANTTLIFEDNQSSARTYVVKLEQESSDGCTNTTTKTITQQPRPTVSYDFPDDNCSGDVVPTGLSVTGADTYLWEVVSGSGLIIDNPNDLNTGFSVDNTGTTALTFEVQLTASVAATGCATSETRTLTIAPQPNMVITGVTDPICNGASINLSSNTSQSNNGEDFERVEWFVNESSVSTDVGLTQALANNGTSDVLYDILLVGTNSNGCVDSAEVTITVYPDARAEIVSTQSQACFPFLIDETIISLTEYPDANTDDYLWEVDSAGTIIQTVTGITPPSYEITEPDISITYRLTAFSRNGCEDDMDEFTFISFPGTVAEFNPSESEACEDVLITFSNTSTNAASSSWDFGDGRTSSEQSPSRSFENTSFTEDVNYTVKLITETSDGCVDSTEQEIVIHPKPFAQWSTNGVCAGEFLTVTNQSFGKGDLTYQWTVDNPAGITFSDDEAREPTITFDDTQGGDRQFNVTLEVTSEDGCTETFTSPIVIASRPTALFQEVPLSCNDVTTTFQNLSENESASAPDSLFIWDYGDGSFDTLMAKTAVGHIYADTGRYTVSLTAINTAACSDVFTSEVRIIAVPDPVISFTQNPESGCAPLTVTFSSDSSVVYNEGETYSWDFGNGDPGSNLRNPDPVVFQQEENGEVTYTVSLTITNICGTRTVTQDILVRPIPTADFSFVPFTAGCDDVEITILNESRGLAETFIWDYGDGSPIDTLTSREPMTHIYQNDGNVDTVYTATLIAINDCGRDTTTRDITIIPFNDNATINILADGDVFCVGDQVTVVAAGLGGTQGRLINWTFNGIPQESNDTITLDLTTPGIFDINLDVEVLACEGFIRDTLQIEVQEGPEIDFEVASSTVCLGESVEVSNLSPTPSAATIWDFGDGSVPVRAAVPPPYTYAMAGTYTIRMTLANAIGCVSEDSLQVQVNTVPVANFETEPFYCEDVTYTFESASTDAQSFKWKILETQDSSFNDVFPRAFAEPQVYTIELTAYEGLAQQGCFNTFTQQIVVSPNPIAAFEFSEMKVCEDSSIVIQNNSIGGNTFRWTLVDAATNVAVQDLGGTLGNQDLEFTVPSAGSYQVSVEAISTVGCSNVASEPLTIVANPQIVVDSSLTFICRGLDFNIANRTEIPDAQTGTFSWFVNNEFVGSEYQIRSDLDNATRRQGVSDSIRFRLEVTNDICFDFWEERFEVPGYFGCNVVVPNAFSPNRGQNQFGDGFNDFFRPIFNPADTANIQEVEMLIFTQTENLVHQVVMKRADGIGSPMECAGSERICQDFAPEKWTDSVAWDGTFNGKEVDDNRGVYFYSLRVKCCEESPKTITGNLQLIW